MTQYVVNVEIPSATSAQNEELSVRMSALGLLRTVAGTSGKQYRLPPNTYHGDLSIESGREVREKVSEAARGVSGSARVLVTQGPSFWTLVSLS